MGLGPVFAAAKALGKVRLELADCELFEINEAFAAQVLACIEAAPSRRLSHARSWRASRPLGEFPLDRLEL
jgi:hypothetical protein